LKETKSPVANLTGNEEKRSEAVVLTDETRNVEALAFHIGTVRERIPN
jgi:hypothetical protein